MRANVTCLIDAGEPIDTALRRFKKACDKATVFGEMRRRESYLSPGARRRRKHAVAVKRAKRRLARLTAPDRER